MMDKLNLGLGYVRWRESQILFLKGVTFGIVDIFYIIHVHILGYQNDKRFNFICFKYIEVRGSLKI